MDIQQTPIGDIKPYPTNPRIISDEVVTSVAKSIETFGWQQPIVVDKNGFIIAGHTRYMAAQKLEQETVPVQRADELTPEQVAAYRILDNKLGDMAEWNEELLDVEFMKFDASEWHDEFTFEFNKELDDLGKYDFSVDDEDDEPTGGLGNPIIQYTIIFDNELQQEKWNALLRHLKAAYPSDDSIASKLTRFVAEALDGKV